jgi:hypothetical protein
MNKSFSQPEVLEMPIQLHSDYSPDVLLERLAASSVGVTVATDNSAWVTLRTSETVQVRLEQICRSLTSELMHRWTRLSWATSILVHYSQTAQSSAGENHQYWDWDTQQAMEALVTDTWKLATHCRSCNSLLADTLQ